MSFRKIRLNLFVERSYLVGLDQCVRAAVYAGEFAAGQTVADDLGILRSACASILKGEVEGSTVASGFVATS